MQSRINLFTCPGGDTIQLLKTKEYLEKIDVEVDVSVELEPNLDGYDIVHLFNLTRVQETYIQMLNAKRQNKPIILSTVYWPSHEFEKIGQKGVRRLVSNMLSVNQIESLKACYKYVFKGERNKGTRYLMTHSFDNMQRQILNLSDWFLPNSKLEMDQIEEVLNFKTDNYTVVPNAIDKERVVRSLEENNDEFERFENYILCVGRIETRKNQENLIKALEGSDYKVLFVGKVAPSHQAYGDKILEQIEANSNYEYIDSISNDLLYQLYKKCKVHILISWFETPGLVSLEAASMGCNVVVSDRGTTKDYFKDYAFYCAPNDTADIRKAIDKAYKQQYDIGFREYILENYTWEKAAEKTLEGYYLALQNRKVNSV
ncbi:glycosyltransferase [Bacillus sp. BP-3]|uniref:glycosyltransferase n=1 Tax=Bacillus sp. BP-3 TaxID=3022773 RepID=UPI00232CB31D|nr:glycosyltransferase [Bacillus sp. BP-3]